MRWKILIWVEVNIVLILVFGCWSMATNIGWNAKTQKNLKPFLFFLVERRIKEILIIRVSNPLPETDDQVTEILIIGLRKYWWSGDRNTDDQLAADTLANSPRLSSLPPPPFYSWNTARSDNNCTGQTAASPGHRCTLARCRGSIRCWPGGSEQGGWWWTHRWTGEERGGRLARDWLPARPIPGPALLACSNTACHGADPPKLGRQQQLCRRWLFPLSMSTKMASSGIICSNFFGHCVTWLLLFPC